MATGLSGIASGVDTASIVDQLMSLERQPVTRLGYKQRAVTAEQTALRGIQDKLKTLGSAVETLRGSSAWGDKQSVTSSDATKVAVTQPEGFVPPSAVTMKVDALATGAQSRFTWTAPAADTKLWVADGVGVTLKAGATVQDAANAINSTGKAVYAGIVDGQLVLTTRTTGAAQTPPELREGTTFADGTAWTAARTVAGTNADVTVNGVRDTSHATNDFWLGDQGLHVTLKSTTTTDVTLTATPPSIDKDAVKAKVKAFVDAYNDIITTINKHVTEKPVSSPEIGLDYEKGTLYGDAGLNAVVAAMRKQVTERISGLDDAATTTVSEPDELFDIGISTGKGANGASSADAKLGKLVIDDAKLDAALADPSAVQALFAGRGGVGGFSAAFEKLSDTFAGTSGSLEARAKGADGRIRLMQQQVTSLEKRLESKEARYKAQFAAMETAMANAQNTGNWLAGQIAGLPSWS